MIKSPKIRKFLFVFGDLIIRATAISVVEVEPGLLLISIKLYFNSTISLITIIGDILEKYWRYIGDVLEI